MHSMSLKTLMVALISHFILNSCTGPHINTGAQDENLPEVKPEVIESLKQIASTEGFEPYSENPVVKPGEDGKWDAGALGSMTVLKVRDVFHMYYESWGERSEKEWDAAEYESLQIGHATSTDGITWIKDPKNPALPKGGEADFDRTGVWDPFVIYEDGLFKMWYGGGGGSQPNFGWAYATSKDGSTFEKKGLIGIGNQTGVEDVHVVHDRESGMYYMYYWYGWDEPNALYLVISSTETGFDFNEAIPIKIEGDNSFMSKFGHVLKDEDGWHMFYSNFVQPYCPNSITRYAFSTDGIHWEAKNKRLLKGHDSEVLTVTNDLHLMFYSPQGYFDRADCDIRLGVYNGLLKDLADKAPFVDFDPPTSIVGQKLIIPDEEGNPIHYHFKIGGEVVVSEKFEDEEYAFSAYYTHDGEKIHIVYESYEVDGIYDGKTINFIN